MEKRLGLIDTIESPGLALSVSERSDSVSERSNSDSEVIKIREYLHVLRKYWVLIFFIFVLFLGGGIFYTARQPRMYRAVVSLSVTPPRSQKIGDIQIERDDYSSWGKSYINTQIETIKNYSMGQKVIESMSDSKCLSLFGVARERLSPKAIINSLDITNKRDTNVIYIRCKHKIPKASAEIANRVAQIFSKENEEQAENVQYTLLKWLKEETPKIREKILWQKKALLEFEKKNPEVSYLSREKNGRHIDKIDRLRTELLELDIQMTTAEINYNKCQNARKHPSLDIFLALDFLQDNAMLQQIRQKQFNLEEKLDKYKLKYKNNHPTIIGLKKNYKKLNKRLMKKVDLLMAREEQMYLDLKTKKVRLKMKFEIEQKKSQEFKEKYVKYEHDRSEYETSQRTYKSFIDKLKQLNSIANYRTDNIHIIDRAREPKTAFSPNKFRNYLLSSILGLIVGIGLAFFLDVSDERVKTPQEVQQTMNTQILGFVPFMSSRIFSNKAQAVVEKDKSMIAEAFRSVSTSLFLSIKDYPQCFVFTSSMPKDGKTTLLCNLGFTIAKAGQKVLLVDGDLHKPQLHRIFNLSKGTGFSELLQSKIEFQDAVQQIQENLWCIQAGEIPQDVYDSIHKSKLKSILKLMQENYRYVLIDSPPMGATNDALLLGKEAQGVIFVTAIYHSHKKMLKQFSQRLQTLEVPLRGVIINDSKGNVSTMHSYYSYHGRYHNKGYQKER